MKRFQRLVFAMFALTAVLSAPIFAQTTPVECVPTLDRAVASSAELITIVETANEIARRLPSRARVAGIEDTANRLYLTKILDHVEAAQRADKMSQAELEEFAAGLEASVSSAQVGISACAVEVSDTVAFEQRAQQAQAAGCSCVQTCYNEWRANLRTCNGGYWCQVGYNLLFELCLADCLVPG